MFAAFAQGGKRKSDISFSYLRSLLPALELVDKSSLIFELHHVLQRVFQGNQLALGLSRLVIAVSDVDSA